MSRPWKRQPRDAAGRFAESSASEVDLPAGLSQEQCLTSLPLREQLCADGDRLWELVESADPSDRVTAAESVHLTSEQIEALRGDDSFAVRSTMALRPEMRAVSSAATDRDPVVRAIALRSGLGLGPAARARLAADPRVVRAGALLEAS